MTRFTITDDGMHRRATAQLDQAGRRLKTVIAVASQDLDEIEASPQRAAEMLAIWRRRQDQIIRYENELLLVLHECGASDRALAEVMGLNRQTITRRLNKARDERESRQ